MCRVSAKMSNAFLGRNVTTIAGCTAARWRSVGLQSAAAAAVAAVTRTTSPSSTTCKPNLAVRLRKKKRSLPRGRAGAKCRLPTQATGRWSTVQQCLVYNSPKLRREQFLFFCQLVKSGRGREVVGDRGCRSKSPHANSHARPRLPRLAARTLSILFLFCELLSPLRLFLRY